MTVKDVPEALQSSALASLFLNLDDPETKEETDKGVTAVRLKLKPMLPDQSPHLLIIESEHKVSFRMPEITRSKNDVNCIGRVGHVNLAVSIGRLYWDPDDGEIGVDWVLRKGSGTVISPESIEYIIACLMEVYYSESLYFLNVKLHSSDVSKFAQPLMDAAKKEYKDTFEPAIHAAME